MEYEFEELQFPRNKVGFYDNFLGNYWGVVNYTKPIYWAFLTE